MKRMSAALTIAALLSVSVLGQSNGPAPSFEIAAVDALPASSYQNIRGDGLREGRYELRNATMLDLIRTAYAVRAESVVGGPSWLEVDRFDVVAKAPPGTTADGARRMLQSLLADRFKLVIRDDKRQQSAFVLTVASDKPKLKAAGGTGGTCSQKQMPVADSAPITLAVCPGVTMAALAEQMPVMAGAYVTTPVTDATGLSGSFDIEIRWHARFLLDKAGPDAITFADALEKQLGLKLEMKPTAVSVLAVESVNRQPTANAPNVAALLPPTPPPTFETAVIRPSPPEARTFNVQFQPNGMARLTAMPLRGLISMAWDIGDRIDGPDWITSERFDIVGRAASGPAGAGSLGVEALAMMIRALLVERFKMKTRFENRPVQAFTMTAGTPKLTKADPASRTRCAVVNVQTPRGGNPVPLRRITCQNATMEYFGQQLRPLSGGYISAPVADATGLQGGWDFSVTFTPFGAFQASTGRGAPIPAAPRDGLAAAPDPSGMLSLNEAIERQLGLKMETRVRPLPVLVIEHIERAPVD